MLMRGASGTHTKLVPPHAYYSDGPLVCMLHVCSEHCLCRLIANRHSSSHEKGHVQRKQCAIQHVLLACAWQAWVASNMLMATVCRVPVTMQHQEGPITPLRAWHDGGIHVVRSHLAQEGLLEKFPPTHP